MKKLHYFLLAILLMFFGFFLLNVPVPVGLADNTDFHRVTQPMGLTVEECLRYYYFQPKFNYNQAFDSLKDHIRFVITPPFAGCFKSTQIIPLKFAQLVNALVIGTGSGKTYFDITLLGIILLGLHSMSVVLIWKSIPIRNMGFRIGLLLLIILVYYDMGYLLYYHSFFGEAITLVSFLVWLAVLLHLLQKETISYFQLIVYFFSSVVFIGAKAANIPLSIFIAGFSVYFLLKVRKPLKRVVIIIGICSILATSVHYYQAIPLWMKKIDNYHAIFFGVLKNSEEPAKDLQKLNIDIEYAVLANTNGYSYHHGYDIYSASFQKSVYDKAGPFQVALFYLKNPGRLLEKLRTSSEACLMLRPAYLGNYSKDADTEIVKFSNRFSAWEAIRKKMIGFAFPIISAVLVLDLALILYQFILLKKIKHQQQYSFRLIWVRVLLIFFAGIQWVFPVIGNGEADLAKHMFLFNLLLDTIFLMMVADIFRLLEEKQKKFVLLFVGLLLVPVLLSVMSKSTTHNTFVFGRINGRDIVWQVLEETDAHYFIVADDIVATRAFSSQGSSLWEKSELRQWLNDENAGGFLYEFSVSEKEKILSESRKTLVPPDQLPVKEPNLQAHYWVSTPGYATQNYDNAYGVWLDERVFLLSVKEWEAYRFDRNKGMMYWLRTPYTMKNAVRIIGEDGHVYHKNADMTKVGVLPALYLKK